jgi:glycosyltransferase involved in cell wall biosynthesis
MPAYNAEKYIGEAIQSVLAQTHSNWELIVIDDGSTDGTADAVRRIAANETRITYLFQENSRLGKARNNAIQHSSGNLIAFLDSDDIWLPQKLEIQLRTQKNTNADVIFTGAHIFWEDNVSDETKAFPIVPGMHPGNEMLDLLLKLNFIPVMSVMMKREAFDTAGPFEEAAAYHGCEDYDLWLKLAKRGALFYGIEEKLIRYRRHSAAMTHKDSHVLKPMLRVVTRHIKDGGLSEAAKIHRVRTLYRELIASLIEEGESAEAEAYLKEFSRWDKSGLVTSLQNVLLKITPRGFNFISREFLYRTEWHLKKLTGGNG